MTGRNGRRAALGAILVLLAGAATPARAQFGRANPTATANPLVNPYANPYLNPYMTTMPMDRDVAFLSLLAAQRASGGIGSGNMAQAYGTRPTDGAPPPSVMRPGAAAAGYFQRGPSARGEKGRWYYQRHNSYFGRNGR